MPRYRQGLPQLSGSLFVTDGGLETSLIFQEGFELPAFAAFVLLEDETGRDALRRYFRGYAEIARDAGAGLVLDSPTWRASADWGARLGYSASALDDLNRRAIDLLGEIRAEYVDVTTVISGCMGPRGDGYAPAQRMTAADAEDYHRPQLATFADSEADMIAAFTLSYVEEAIGIARAARSLAMPAVISFTVETDGRLASGRSLREAIEQTDAATDAAPAYYMVNCAHPTHFLDVLEPSSAWVARIRAVRANASRLSHAELDQAQSLDDGDPRELSADYRLLAATLTNLNVLGGCCGTDQRHVREICSTVSAAP